MQSDQRSNSDKMASAVNSANSLRRILVGIKTLENSDTVKIARFVDCLVNYFAPNSLSVNVGCKLEDDVLVLYPASPNFVHVKREKSLSDEKLYSSGTADFGNVVLQHSPTCPVMLLEETEEAALSIPESTQNRGVHVGVTVVLESSDSHILLTQRSGHMRSFPGAWVPPGGNIESGESLVEGGLRELYEETGLCLNVDLCPESDQSPSASQGPSVRVLCLWESVFPAFLSAGPPRYHHAVVYLHVVVSKNKDELQNAIKLDPDEVQACVWLNEEDVRALVSDNATSRTVLQWKAGPGSDMTPKLTALSSMFLAPWLDEPLTGVQAALCGWLRLKDSSRGGCGGVKGSCNKSFESCRI
ncbi:nucleoside diphosphate-linked moiety X motif 17-like [Schistocerca americana]|uniref:nucleoside diphosphate-linked moiety X motif 17-like n=1 Tax=Schistocerca americana TaxID=7009 RepID=UPI001F4F8E34|nr:nucleoside diphosphate-linked moiety X motif 17-like [Schistocerca americana]XP_049946311.1 nucleoside diphosphate-linked moiety X motif 17-like [Schistocerca serialis cubense]